MKTKLPLPTEHQVQTDIIQYLRMNKYYVMRINSGKYSVGEGRFKRFIQGAEKGTPDLMAFKPFNKYLNRGVRVFFIEVKRSGNEPTLSQIMKMNELEQYGASCVVAHSVKEVEDAGL